MINCFFLSHSGTSLFQNTICGYISQCGKAWFTGTHSYCRLGLANQSREDPGKIQRRSREDPEKIQERFRADAKKVGSTVNHEEDAKKVGSRVNQKFADPGVDSRKGPLVDVTDEKAPEIVAKTHENIHSQVFNKEEVELECDVPTCNLGKGGTRTGRHTPINTAERLLTGHKLDNHGVTAKYGESHNRLQETMETLETVEIMETIKIHEDPCSKDSIMEREAVQVTVSDVKLQD